MAGSVEVLCGSGDSNGKVEPLPEEISSEFLLLITENGGAKESGKNESREIVLGKNVHTTCLAVTEPDADDEITGDRDAYMASVLARYRKSLIERTKHHLGMQNLLFLFFLCSFEFVHFRVYYCCCHHSVIRLYG